MNIVRRAVLFTLEVNKIQAESMVKLYGLVGVYRRIYCACGIPAHVELCGSVAVQELGRAA